MEEDFGITVDGDPFRDDLATETVGELLEPASSASYQRSLGRGSYFGRYIVLGPLGRGGMSEVYAAYDPELDRKVALKMLRAGRLSRASRLRLIREAQTLARLSHPNIITVYDVGAVGEQVFLTMELIEGMTLAGWLAQRQRPWREILQVFLDAGQGLSAAHRAGILHRDFKPSNVMVSRQGRVQVLDFGLACKLDDLTPQPEGDPHQLFGSKGLVDRRLTRTGTALGTPAYMAPEQLRGQADARSDQFSFCVALYEALYGQLPFTSWPPDEKLASSAPDPVPEPPASASVASWLWRALRRGLAFDPAERFTSLEDLLSALSQDPTRRRKQRIATAAVLLLTLTGMVTGFRTWKTREELCQGAGRRLQGIWDPARQLEIEKGFATSSLSYAPTTWGRVKSALDDYAEAWTATYAAACEATHRWGEQSPRSLDQQMACLETRLVELSSVVDFLAQTDEAVVRRAVQVARGLSEVESCRDRVGAAPSLPADAELAERVNEVRAQFARAKVLANAGRYESAFTLIEQAAARAETLGYRPLIAEAHYYLAGSHGRLRKADEMRTHLLTAMKQAQATRQDELLVKIFNYLILAARIAGDGEEARLWGELSDSMLERLGSHQALAADRQFFLGMVANMEKEYRQAIEHFEAFLELVTDGSSNQPDHGFHNLGIAYTELGELASAAEFFERAIDESETLYGPNHPAISSALGQIGKLMLLHGEPNRAVDYLQRAIELHERVYLPENPSLAFLLGWHGEALMQLGRASEAVPLLQRAVALHASVSKDPTELAESRFHLARAMWQAGEDPEASRALAVAARDALAASGERARKPLQEVQAWLTETATP